MAKTTIAEKRATAAIELANRTNGNIENARKAMNAYYRLCRLEERLLNLENDSRTHNTRYTKQLQEREERAIERVKKYFEEFNATLIWFGYLPTICDKEKKNDLYLAYFYN